MNATKNRGPQIPKNLALPISSSVGSNYHLHRIFRIDSLPHRVVECLLECLYVVYLLSSRLKLLEDLIDIARSSTTICNIPIVFWNSTGELFCVSTNDRSVILSSVSTVSIHLDKIADDRDCC